MKKTQQIATTYRQGDVLLKQIAAIPGGTKKQEARDRIVLAYGEVTGHAHAIHDLDSVEVYVGQGGELYLEVKSEGCTLRHEEHAAIAIPPGQYERVLQREYSPEAIRNVAD
jgi:hypothetical protein